MLPNKNSSKHALYLITIAVLSFLLIFGVFAHETYGYTDLTVKPHISQSEASDSVSVGIVEAEIRRIAEQENFNKVDYLIRLAKCESNLNPNAIGDNGNSRGLFQIHKGYWPKISDEKAFDIEWSTKFTMDMINSGYQHYWSCDRLI